MLTLKRLASNNGGGTLYILNCSDANGWWITGYTAQSLAEDLYKMLSPYFVKTVMVQNTAQLGQIMDGQYISVQGETVQNAVIINTFGEAVPMPTAYCSSTVNSAWFVCVTILLHSRSKSSSIQLDLGKHSGLSILLCFKHGELCIANKTAGAYMA